MSKITSNILYLERQKITYCGYGLKEPQILDVPPNVFFDMEVIDPEAFDNLLASWFEKSGLTPSNILVILSSSVYYETAISHLNDAAQKKAQTDSFLKNIPFKNLFSRDYYLDSNPKLIAVNKDFYEPIIRCLEKNHFHVIAIIPNLILDHFHLTLKTFTSKEAREIYQKYKQLEPYSLISVKEINKNLSSSPHHEMVNKKRTITLVAVFCFLWVIFLFFVWIRPYIYKQQLAKSMVKAVPSVPVTPQPSQIPTPLLTAVPSISIENTRISIVNSSGIANRASTIKGSLTTSGFTQITTSTGALINGAKNQLNYAPSVSTEVLNQIISSLPDILGDVTPKLVDNLENTDVIITLVKK